MENKGLIKKITGCLGVLALSTVIGGGLCYSKETNLQGYQVPDLSKAEKVATRYDDLTDKIKGKETCVEQYSLKGENNMSVYKNSVNGKAFFYAILDCETDEIYAIADLDGDGVFETKYDEKDLAFTDRRQNEFPAKKDIPPEWVLK